MTMRRASIGTYGTLATVAFVLVVMVTAGMFGIGFSSRLVGGGTGEISSHGSNAGSATPLATPVAAPNHGILDKAYLRAVHLVPDAPAVDVWVNGAVVFSDLSYQGSTAYASMSPGASTVSVTAHG